MRGVRANDLIPGRNERIPVCIDGFRRPKFEKKKNYARAGSDSVSLTLNVLKYVVAFFGPFWRKPRVNMFLVPCLRPLLRALWLPMFVYLAVVINLRLFQWRTKTVRGERKKRVLSSSATWISTKTKTKKKFRPFRVDRFCLLWWVFYLALCYWGKPALKEEEDKALLSFGKEGGGWSVSPRSSVSLCEKADPPPTTHQSFHPRRRRHPTKKKTKGCSVLFRSFSEQTEHKRTVDDDPRENLIISSLKNARRFLPALTVVSLSRSIHQRRSLKNTLGSLRTEEEEGE